MANEKQETLGERLVRLANEKPPAPREILDTEQVIGFRRIGINVSLWLVDSRTSGVRRIEISADKLRPDALALAETAINAVSLV